MEIRVLKYFLAVAREQNISKASNYLHVTQPTLSRQIKDLEDELGQKLFIRGNHNVTLTEEGMIFRKRAEQIIDMVSKTEEEFESMKSKSAISGDIYIGAAETYNFNFIAKIIKKQQEEHPDIHYHLFSGNEEEITELLDKGLIDFGILTYPSDITKYDYLHLPNKDTWGLLMKNDSLLAEKEHITKKDLLDIPLIFSRQCIEKGKSENEFINWFGDNFKDLNIIGTFDLVYNVSILVNEGIGYAVVFDKMANTKEYKNICFKPLYPNLYSTLDIVWKKQMIFSKPAQEFLNRLQKELSTNK